MRANFVAALIGMLCVVGCGGGGGSGSVSNGSGAGGGNTPTGSNVQAVTVDTGPSSNSATVNTLYTSVTICVPGSTTNCQTIGHIQVDTGSSGMRILSSALTLALPQQKDSSGNALAECAQFVDGSAWGTLRTADVKIASETASNQVVQVIGDTTYPVPDACNATVPPGGQLEDTVSQFGANGILGIGVFMQDCGSACAQAPVATNDPYFTCTSTNKNGCTQSVMPLAMQVSNPVASFTTDNNGIIIQLPSVNGTAASVSGSLIFGIGTQGNNGFGSAKVFTLDDNGLLTTDYNNNSLSGSAIDSGSNAYFFADKSIAPCTTNKGFFCPSPTLNLTATIVGINGAMSSVNFSVINVDNLLANSTSAIAAISGLAGSISAVNTTSGSSSFTGFDWGLPFYYGRSVYTAIETKNTSAGMGPYFAF